jgi:hypothetical protein
MKKQPSPRKDARFPNKSRSILRGMGTGRSAGRAKILWLWSVTTLLVAACGGAPAPAAGPKTDRAAKASGSALAPVGSPAVGEPPLLPLRTGALAPVEDPPVELPVAARGDDGTYEILRLDLPMKLPEVAPVNAFRPHSDGPRPTIVSLEAGSVGHAFHASGVTLEGNRNVQRLSVWIRRPKSTTAVEGTLYTAADAGKPGHRQRFHATLSSKTPTDPQLKKTWATALAGQLERAWDPASRFSAERLRAIYAQEKPARSAGAARQENEISSELGNLMDTTTGRLSVQRALESRRRLLMVAAKQKPSVPLEKVRAPELAHHPWAELSAALKQTTPDEPLARATPAEFYFARARDFGKFLDLITDIETFGQPVADLLDEHAEQRGTFARYEAELALERSALTRILGPAVVSELALMGSDPYIHEGSDITLIFRVKNAALFSSGLLGSLARHTTAHPDVKESTFTEEGVTVTVRRSADGRIRQHRATLDDLELVSNSPAAIRRVIRTVRGKHPSLASEPDFKYMLERDASTPSDQLLYFGDRFVAQVIGPAQKIAEARRQIALGELMVPGYAALALGLVDGRAPKTLAALLKARFLRPEELRHAGGGAIAWEPGRAAKSPWGSPAALEPLIDLPAVTRVTPAEQVGYESFSRYYEGMWSERIDPVALRLSQPPKQGKTRVISADLRVLPTLRREYQSMMRTVGNARLGVPPLLGGLAGMIGLGEEASIRRELTQMGRVFGGGKRFTFDWLGDYALLGVATRNELANATHQLLSEQLDLPAAEPAPSPLSNVARTAVNLPIYAAIGVKSRVAAGVFLTAVRVMSRDAAIGLANWESAGRYRGQEIVAIRFEERGFKAAVYYALTESALVLSLNEEVLHQVLDQLAVRPPTLLVKGKPEPADAGQVVVELSGNKGDALFQSLAFAAGAAWGLQGNGSRDLARSVLLGARDQSSDPIAVRELMRAYLGTVAVTPDGKEYSLAPDGVRDPVRGTDHAPVYPALPVPGSPLEDVLTRLARVRTALSFDDEPTPASGQPLSSLHARVTLELR